MHDLFDTTTVYGVSATDECSLVVIAVTDNDEISGTCPASYIRTYTATDACGNTSTFEQAVNTIDTVAPTFDFVPEGYTALCHEPHPLELATATDNCADVVDISVAADTVISDDCSQTYTVTRTFTAVDECNNATSAVQVIEIVDTLAPTFIESLPEDTLVDCHAVPAADVLTASDLCQEVEVAFQEDTLMSGDCPQYTLTRTWNVADACGNSTSHIQIVTVVDTLARHRHPGHGLGRGMRRLGQHGPIRGMDRQLGRGFGLRPLRPGHLVPCCGHGRDACGGAVPRWSPSLRRTPAATRVSPRPPLPSRTTPCPRSRQQPGASHVCGLQRYGPVRIQCG